MNRGMRIDIRRLRSRCAKDNRECQHRRRFSSVRHRLQEATAAAMRPSRYFLNRLRKLTNPSEISDKLCRWGKAKAFLDTVGGNGGKQKSGSMAEIRPTTPFQSRLGTREGSPSTISVVPSRLITHYPDRVKQDALDGMIGGGGVEARDRSIKAQRISHTGDLSDGHVSKGKSGGGAGDVCHIPRLVRCVPPHSHEVRFASVPMFPGKGQTLHVPRPTVRPDVRAVGIHGGSEASETVVVETSSHAIPVPRRLVKPIPVAATGGKVDRSISQIVPSSRPISKSREIRARSPHR